MIPLTLLSAVPLRVWVFGAALVAATASGAYLNGLRWENKYTKLETSITVDRAQAKEDAHEMYRLNNRRVAAASSAFQSKQEKSNVVYKEIFTVVTEYIDRPVYRNACIDDDGLRALGRAIDTANRNRPTTP